ncbi:MAG TPA: molybdopterin molybdotransferase MoeA, partial [Opitutales bacterium]|nr:molybdopterin molybdotransferase MoeA [Opitutales bacterium]
PPASGANVRKRGSDARQGEVVLTAGTRLDATELAILAAVGEVNPLVNASPRVAHATTGDEIVPPESIPGPGQIRNTNQILISSLLQNCRIPAANIHQEHWGDDPILAADRLGSEAFAKADIILISGGASVGDHDYTARILEAAGFEIVMRRVNMRPGRPLILAFRGKQIAFGLPGNPVSHFVCFGLFVRHALKRLMDKKMLHWRWPIFGKFSLSQPLKNAANIRPTFWPARLNMIPHNVEPLAWNNSGHLGSLAGANALIFLPPKTAELLAGEKVRTLMLRP